MSKLIKLFEAFAGIGSQYKALTNISKRKKWEIEVVGIIEWFIPAICAYIELYSKDNSLVLRERERERATLFIVTKSGL